MKKLFIVLALVVIALLLGAFLKQGGEVSAPESEIQTKAMEEKAQAQEVSIEQTHTISQATASYTVDKMWFSKPVEKVIGSTSNVKGSLSFDAKTNTLTALNVEINDQTFKSGNDNRDEDVQALFASQGNILVTLAKPVQILNIAEMEPARGSGFHDIELMLKINGVEKKVPFKVTTSHELQGIGAKGEAQINMIDFGIEPPSKFEVFSVGEEAILSFEMTAQQVQ
ncbi:MAG: YceI family protein [Candidatus Paceibacterota bacterium]